MKILTLQETADRMQPPVHVQTIKRHIYDSKILADLVQYLGRSPGFTEDALPEIQRRLRAVPSVGRGAKRSKAETARRQDKALALRQKNMTYEQIAEKLEYKSAAAARSAVQVAEKRAKYQP